MNRFRFVLFCVFTTSLVACSLNFDRSSVSPFQFDSFENIQGAQNFMAISGIKCADKNCPDTVVGIFILDSTQDRPRVRACSGTLISSHQVLTDKSCLPTDLQHKNTSCQGRIRLTFPRTSDFPEQHIECDKIESFSEFEDMTSFANPSWALINMSQSPGRSPRPISGASGLAEADVVSLYTLTFDSNLSNPKGVVRKTQCLANTNHYTSNFHIGSVSSLFDLSDCQHRLKDALPGAGIINQDGELTGLLNLVKSLNINTSNLTKSVNEALSKNPSPNAGGATHIACIAELQGKVHELCEFDKNYQKRALLYRDLLSQRHHTDFIKTHRNIEVSLKDLEIKRIHGIEWTENTFTKLEFNPSLSPQQVFLKLNQLENNFPFIPDCLTEESSSQEFLVKWLKRSVLKQEEIQPGKNLRRLLPSQIDNVELLVTKSSDGNYKVQLDPDASLLIKLCSN